MTTGSSFWSGSPCGLLLSNRISKPCLISLPPPIIRTTSSSSSCLISSYHGSNPLSIRSPPPAINGDNHNNKEKARGRAAVCHAAPFRPHNVQLVAAISSLVLTLARGTPVHKSLIIPFFALQAPKSIISWMKSEYGVWAAFLALFVRLFWHIPGELELPFLTLVLVIIAPRQVINLRGTREGSIISLLIALYLAFQHFSGTGWKDSSDKSSIVASVAIVAITIASFFLLI